MALRQAAVGLGGALLTPKLASFSMADPGPPTPPPPPAGAGVPRTTPFTSWTKLAAEEAAEAAAAGAHAPKPFSPPPPGWSPPSLGELWGYANRRHPYARLGYGAAVVMGLALWGVAAGRGGKEGGKGKGGMERVEKK